MTFVNPPSFLLPDFVAFNLFIQYFSLSFNSSIEHTSNTSNKKASFPLFVI